MDHKEGKMQNTSDFFFHDQHLTENKDGNYVRKEDEYDLHYISKATETLWFSLNYVF